MALSQTNIDALEKALASGALRITFPDGGGVEYRSIDDLKKAIAYAKSQVEPYSTTQSVATFCRD